MLKFLFGILLIVVGFWRTIFVDPVWGIYLFAAFSHIRLNQLGETIQLPLRIPIIIASLTILLYLFSPKYPKIFTRWPAEIWLFATMVLGMSLSAANAEFDSALSWQRTFDYFKYWIFFLLMIQMLNSIHKVEWFYRTLILSSIWLVYRCWDLRGTTGLRFENIGGGNVGDSNHFAAALVLLFPFAYHKTLAKHRGVALSAMILCFGIVMAIFISGSRGGFLGLAALIFLIYLNFKHLRKKLLLSLLVLGLISFSFINNDQKDRLATIFSSVSAENRDESSQRRIDFWYLAWDLFKENPLIGVGAGNFVYHSGYRLEGLSYGMPGHVTHSLWFELLSEGGLLVTLPFIIMLWRFFRISTRLAKNYISAGNYEKAVYVKIPVIALCAFLVSASFLDRSVYEPIYWCIALGVAHRYIAVEEFVQTKHTQESPLRGKSKWAKQKNEISTTNM